MSKANEYEQELLDISIAVNIPREVDLTVGHVLNGQVFDGIAQFRLGAWN